MFGLFKTPPYTDPDLGQFRRLRGLWRGSVQLPGLTPVPLSLSGNRFEPDSQALAAARQLGTLLASWRPDIESALFEHYRPYEEARASGELPQQNSALPCLREPSQVWLHVEPQFVSVSPLDGTMTIELGYVAAWDEEHTLGARFQQGRLVELNGSVLPP